MDIFNNQFAEQSLMDNEEEDGCDCSNKMKWLFHNLVYHTRKYGGFLGPEGTEVLIVRI